MPADLASVASGGRRPRKPRPPLADKPPERAQLVWRRALELAGTTGGDQFALALELLRAAHHSPAIMTHALSLGQTHVRAHPDDGASADGVALLEAANRFLGIKPQAGDVAGPSS